MMSLSRTSRGYYGARARIAAGVTVGPSPSAPRKSTMPIKRARRRPRRQPPPARQGPLERIERRALPCTEQLARFGRRHPARVVDLWEELPAPRSRRPLHLEGVASHLGDLECRRGAREHTHQLARRVAELTEVEVVDVGRRHADLLGELTPRRGIRFLAGDVLALRNRPRTLVLPRRERTAHVRDEHLELGRAAVQEDACARHRHRSAPVAGASARYRG